MNTPTVFFKLISVSPNQNLSSFYSRACLIDSNYYEITDKTSISILLNSSRQVHAPYYARPLKCLPIILYSIWSEQLKTTQNIPKALARSLVDSVLPVPAGP
jgi:hypothetical protein